MEQLWSGHESVTDEQRLRGRGLISGPVIVMIEVLGP
jgi:hypothetical protein